MKIIHICNYFQPQLGYQEYFLSKEHINQGHDVVIITSDRYFPFPDYNNTVGKILGDRIVGIGEFEYDNIKIIRLKVLFEFSARVWLKGLKNFTLEFRPDIVICHGMTSFNSLRIANIKKRIPFKLIYDDHMHFSEENKSFLGKIFYKFFDFKKIHANADKLIGVSPECVDYIIQKYKFPKEIVEMIPLGADTKLFKFNKELRQEFRKNHNVDYKSILITYTGKLTFKKGPHNILLAIKLIKHKLEKNVIILFVGNYELKYIEIFNSAKKDIENDIRIIQIPVVKNKDLVMIYSASDITCWPRQASMSMIEASSCNVPIICCDFLIERYKNNNGIPIKEDNINDLANALLKLINNDELRIKMGRNGRELIEKELSWDVIARKFIE